MINRTPLYTKKLPPPPVWISTYCILNTHIQCVRGGRVWGSGPQTDKQLLQSRFTDQFFDYNILHCLLWALSFYATNHGRKPFTWFLIRKSLRNIALLQQGDSNILHVHEMHAEGGILRDVQIFSDSTGRDWVTRWLCFWKPIKLN
jgi:hypothetical protein